MFAAAEFGRTCTTADPRDRLLRKETKMEILMLFALVPALFPMLFTALMELIGSFTGGGGTAS